MVTSKFEINKITYIEIDQKADLKKSLPKESFSINAETAVF